MYLLSQQKRLKRLAKGFEFICSLIDRVAGINLQEKLSPNVFLPNLTLIDASFRSFVTIMDTALSASVLRDFVVIIVRLQMPNSVPSWKLIKLFLSNTVQMYRSENC